ncbi:MAG: carbon-nitrogen hydrolase family protein [Bacillus sp. (in: Bacteria)]|nr:carbon-nitrogen hydrolase family protein [Bacillus sp. (in: firmicutes)]
MRIFALTLNNDIKGIIQRKEYIESLLASLPSPDFVVLPELALCSYMASREIWQYADDCGKDAFAWTMKMAEKYHTFIGTGYLDKENGDYYNRYLVADKSKVFGVVTKSEGEAAVFKRGSFDNVIHTPFGNIGVAICYDAKRKHFYENVKNKELSLILFPHGAPADPKKPEAEQNANDFFCGAYEKAFHVPVVYANSKGRLAHMPGQTGQMMEKAGFAMNGFSKIYYPEGTAIDCDIEEAVGADIVISPQMRKSDIRFYGENITRGNCFFRQFILKPDIKAGIKAYEENRQS